MIIIKNVLFGHQHRLTVWKPCRDSTGSSSELHRYFCPPLIGFFRPSLLSFLVAFISTAIHFKNVHELEAIYLSRFI